MRLARKLFLLTVMALAAMAVAAGSASAQEEAVDVVSEGTAEPCSIAASNCEIHVAGDSVLTLHAFGSESQNSACNDEFEATLDENGNGYIDSYTNNVGDADCTKIMCNDEGESPWDVTETGEFAGTAGEGHITVRFCLDEESNPGAAGRHCDVEIDVEAHPNHAYGFEAVNEECPVIGMTVWTELNGNWESEATPVSPHDDIEIIHAP